MKHCRLQGLTLAEHMVSLRKDKLATKLEQYPFGISLPRYNTLYKDLKNFEKIFIIPLCENYADLKKKSRGVYSLQTILQSVNTLQIEPREVYPLQLEAQECYRNIYDNYIAGINKEMALMFEMLSAARHTRNIVYC